MKAFDPKATGPLAAMRVLDLSRFICGNMLSLLLADFGADVVKIEDPGALSRISPVLLAKNSPP
jgi:crotonobetainyl-CoA:carnitine CoA-transferase CaiB-like acyl-CoA transferase